MNNPIIEEVRATRESLAAQFDFDLHRIVADAIKRQGKQRTVNRQISPQKTVRSESVVKAKSTPRLR